MVTTNFKSFIGDESGLEIVEYAIILGLIIVGVIGALVGIGAWALSRYEAVNTDLAANPATAPGGAAAETAPVASPIRPVGRAH